HRAGEGPAQQGVLLRRRAHRPPRVSRRAQARGVAASFGSGGGAPAAFVPHRGRGPPPRGCRPPRHCGGDRPMRELPRYFVTGTDTGVGKTEVAAALLSLMADAGLAPGALKPYESGCVDVERPADALALRAAARSEDAL